MVGFAGSDILERHPFLAKAHFREIEITQALEAFASE